MFQQQADTLNATSTALREAEPQAPKHLKDVLIKAADELDDLSKACEDKDAELRLSRKLMKEWAVRLEGTTNIRIGQMDSDSRAAEKMQDARGEILEVVRLMREVSL